MRGGNFRSDQDEADGAERTKTENCFMMGLSHSSFFRVKRTV